MFTLSVMISTIVLLFFSGIRILKKIKESSFWEARMLIAGIFLIAVGISLYIVRDFYTQLGMYQVQEIFTRLGGFLHVLGGVLIFWFFCREFTSKIFEKISLLIGLVLLSLMMIGINITPLDSEIIKAPFEPFPYDIVRNFPLEKISLGTPISWLVALTLFLFLTIILYNVLGLKNKEKRRKGLLYGVGFIFLIFPLLVCVFISPIYARWGYLVGSILLFKACTTKV